jgi:hypothetical protein
VKWAVVNGNMYIARETLASSLEWCLMDEGTGKPIDEAGVFGTEPVKIELGGQNVLIFVQPKAANRP